VNKSKKESNRAAVWDTVFKVDTWSDVITYTFPLQDKEDKSPVDERTYDKIKKAAGIAWDHYEVLAKHITSWGEEEADRLSAALQYLSIADILSYKLLNLPQDHSLVSKYGRGHLRQHRIHVLRSVVYIYGLLQRGQFHETIFDCCLEAIELGNEDHLLLYYAGSGWCYKKKYRRSINLLEKALKTKSNDFSCYIRLSLDYYYLEQYDEALRYNKKAEETAESIHNLTDVSSLYLLIMDWPRAIIVFDKIIDRLHNGNNFKDMRLSFQIKRHITIYFTFSQYLAVEETLKAVEFHTLYCVDSATNKEMVDVLNNAERLKEVLHSGAGASESETEDLSKSYYRFMTENASHAHVKQHLDTYLQKLDEANKQKRKLEEYIKLNLLPQVEKFREDSSGDINIYKKDFWVAVNDLEAQINPLLLDEREQIIQLRFPVFSTDVVHFIGLADLLYELYQNSFSKSIDHTPVIELYCKAIERETKDWLLLCGLAVEGSMGALASNIKTNINLLIAKSKPPNLSEGKYRHILIRLKEALFTIAKEHRNGPIHYDLAPRHTVEAFLNYIQKEKVMYLLTELGRSE